VVAILPPFRENGVGPLEKRGFVLLFAPLLLNQPRRCKRADVPVLKSGTPIRANRRGANQPTTTPMNAFNSKDYISVSDNIRFSTIADACNSLFSTNYIRIFKSYFTPSTFPDSCWDGYKIWFPHHAKKDIYGRFTVPKNNLEWMNVLSESGEQIYSRSTNAAKNCPSDEAPERRLVFMSGTDNAYGYKFVGVFEPGIFDDGWFRYERISDECKLI
jgi:hypothetical protein